VLKFAKKPGNIIFIVAALFIMTVVGVALQPSSTLAAPVSGVGYVDFALLVSQHPDAAAAQQTMKAAAEQAQKEFTDKSANMNDQDKRVLFGQMQQQLDAKERELVGAIQAKVTAVVKDVADKKGLSIVIDKSVAIYGGEDITSEVGKKLTGQ
jgi:outer membrane protein